VARQRPEAEQQVAELLRTAKESLQISVAFLTRMDGTTQHLEVVESSVPFLFKEGATQKQETTFCQAILDGRLPAVMGNVKDFPLAMTLPAARIPRIRSYVSVPVVLSDGTLYGTFCAAGLTSDKGLTKRDKSLMDVLAHAAAVIIEPGIRSREQTAEIEKRLWPVLESGGPVIVLQPIVDLATGVRVGAEALSRFPQEWQKAPDIVFAEAHSVGLGHELELIALSSAADLIAAVPGYVAMNISPATLLTPSAVDFLSRLPLDRILLELSEHDQVEDYDALHTVLAPLRAQGMSLAIDDVGAGFSSLRHIVLTRPDTLKIDRTLVDGVSHDEILTTLVHSLVDFGHGMGAKVVAEGIETGADAAVLLQLGVDYGQGWYFGRPGPVTEMLARDAGQPADAPFLPSQPASREPTHTA
jgi:EAL domain-containing protein (putative c-di-GMP-specific phosphodiesterase class I)